MSEVIERETMEFDVIIVGAGPAGLSCAIKLKQLNAELNIVVLEKAAEVGGHILSGAILETRALDELLPDWQNMNAPITTKVSNDQIYWLKNQHNHWAVPNVLAPSTLHNDGNYIVSLGNVCRWLAEHAEKIGIDIYPGFSAQTPLFNEHKTQVLGVITGDMGIGKNGAAKSGFTAGMELRAPFTVFAEGSRGHLGKQLIEHFALNNNKSAQHYGLGIKELWTIPAAQHQEGSVIHTAGWPLNEHEAVGGGFLYHIADNQVVVGLVTDLNYSNPWLSPFEEFQRLKTHPIISAILKNGERVSYGARAITKGGLQALPKMSFNGGCLIGCDAGTLNFAKIKGSHLAMKSGLLAAQAIETAIKNQQIECDLDTLFAQSWAYEELHAQRNFGPAMHRFGNFVGAAYAFIDINIFKGKLPWTMHDEKEDYLCLRPADHCPEINYPKPDGKLTFDRLSSVFLSNTNHEEDQPVHLKLTDLTIPLTTNMTLWAEPAQRYCPAGVYEIIEKDNNKQFQINAQNCLHCKTCDIKDPSQNINWVAPEGGGGPNYPNM